MKGTIVGAGFFAKHHIEAWKRIPEVQITAIADLSPGLSQEAAARWGIAQSYEDAATMIERERPDFVDLITGPYAHVALVELAARQGAQVICQKPMAPTWGDCLKMIEIARSHGVRLLMHENWRWQPWFREIKRLLADGVGGKVFQAGFFMRAGDGRGDNPYAEQPYFRLRDRLMVDEMLVHLFDTLRYLIDDIEAVYCQRWRVNPLINGDDSAIVQLTFSNGGHGIIDANRLTGPAKPALTNQTLLIEGDRGAIRMTPEGNLWITDETGVEREHQFEHVKIDGVGYKGDSVYELQKHFLDCFTTGVRCASEADEYLKTVAVVFACYKSAELNRVVAVEEIFQR
jgi:predicted dehydrogenase